MLHFNIYFRERTFLQARSQIRYQETEQQEHKAGSQELLNPKSSITTYWHCITLGKNLILLITEPTISYLLWCLWVFVWFLNGWLPSLLRTKVRHFTSAEDVTILSCSYRNLTDLKSVLGCFQPGTKKMKSLDLRKPSKLSTSANTKEICLNKTKVLIICKQNKTKVTLPKKPNIHFKK